MKLHSQLDQWVLGPAGALPDWVTRLTQTCPFLFERRARQKSVRLTSFGVAHALHASQTELVDQKYGRLQRDADRQISLAQSSGNEVQLAEAHNTRARVEERYQGDRDVWVGRMKIEHAKVIRGEPLLPMAEVLLAKTCSSEALLEVGFEGETGFGSAVTQSFFSACANELARRNVDCPMWVDGEARIDEFHVSRRGLYIAPLAADDPRLPAVCSRFRFLGRLIAKAMREHFLVPLALTHEVFGLLRGDQLSWSSLPQPGDQWSGEMLGAFATFSTAVQAADPAAVPAMQVDPSWARTYLRASYDLSFQEACDGCAFLSEGTSGTPLCPGGADLPVNLGNLREFLNLAADFWLRTGVQTQVDAMRAGIDDVFPSAALRSFSAAEFRNLVCGEREVEWTREQIKAHFEWSRGLHPDKPPAIWLVDSLMEMVPTDRSRFLDFVTSCPSLPPGGLGALGITVHLLPDQGDRLPRSRACANAIYIPKYSTKASLQEKLNLALANFHGMHEVVT